MAFQRGQSTPERIPESAYTKLEQFNQRFGTTCASTKSLQWRTSGPHSRHIPRRHLSDIEHRNKFFERLGPTQFAVGHMNHGIGVVDILRHARQLFYILRLYAEADAGTVHQYVQNLVKGPWRIDCDVRTIIPRDIFP